MEWGKGGRRQETRYIFDVYFLSNKKRRKPGVGEVFVYYNGESEREREEMIWCRCYEGQRDET